MPSPWLAGETVADTLTFTAAIINPILAVWSLGQPGNTARFTFTASEPFTIEGGGPDAQYGGAAIFTGGTCPANSICGTEGNGVIQFNGTFTSLTWTNPAFENYYAFTVGATAAASGGEVPEPASILLLGSGLLAVGVFARRKSTRKS